jgi:hypothetical protein
VQHIKERGADRPIQREIKDQLANRNQLVARQDGQLVARQDGQLVARQDEELVARKVARLCG